MLDRRWARGHGLREFPRERCQFVRLDVWGDRDRVARVAPFQRVRGAKRDDLPVVDDRYPIAELVGLVEVVRGEEHRGSTEVSQRPEQRPQVGSVLRVEAGGWLVKEQHQRLMHHAERDLEPPALTAGVGTHRAVGEFGQLEYLGEFGAPLAGSGRAQPVQPPREQQVLPSGSRRVRPAELSDISDPPPHQRRVPPDVRPGDERGARVGGQQRGEDAHGRGLAGTVGAEQPEDLALGDGQVDPADGLDGLARYPEVPAHPADFDHGAHPDSLTHLDVFVNQMIDKHGCRGE
jgi:hypothetical protein